MILATFDLQVTLILPTKFQVILPSVQEKKWKIDFQDGGHSGHLGFLIRSILAVFDLQVIPMLPTKIQVNWPFSSGEEMEKKIFKMAAMAVILDFGSELF